MVTYTGINVETAGFVVTSIFVGMDTEVSIDLDAVGLSIGTSCSAADQKGR
jgi:hypothetical protein